MFHTLCDKMTNLCILCILAAEEKAQLINSDAVSGGESSDQEEDCDRGCSSPAPAVASPVQEWVLSDENLSKTLEFLEMSRLCGTHVIHWPQQNVNIQLSDLVEFATDGTQVFCFCLLWCLCD